MNRFYLLMALFLLFVSLALEADARPTKRFDATTQTCRNLADGQLEWHSRPWGDGGKVFRKVCKTCHARSNDKGAPFLWTESKSSKGWNRVFARKYPECAKDGSWDAVSLDQQLKLNDYLYRFANDSQDRDDNA